MYVCICKGITEEQIIDAIRCGVCTRKDISRCLKVGTACGKCNQDVRNLLQNGAAAPMPTGTKPPEAIRMSRAAESTVCLA